MRLYDFPFGASRPASNGAFLGLVCALLTIVAFAFLTYVLLK